MKRGSIAIVLHAHLPYVRHPEHDQFLEEYWFYEAMIECYLPLLRMMRRLTADKVQFRLTLSLSPTLLAMMSDDLLIERFDRRLDNLVQLCEKELKSQRKGPYQQLARFYDRRLRGLRTLFRTGCRRNVIGGFAEIQETGSLEIITSAATHPFLPFLASSPNSVRAQIAAGLAEYERHFSFKPAGIWLPECAYFPGVDEVLAEQGVRYFIVDTHGIEHARPRPKHGVLEPVKLKSGVAAFGRDDASARQVWSSHEGYPGDYWYREFYRDIAYERDADYIIPHLPGRTPFDTGLKYHRITGGPDKEPYVRTRAMARTSVHAEHFVMQRVLELLRSKSAAPVLVAPYDAELFGHWWFEGPDWLERVFRIADGRLPTTTLSGYLDRKPKIAKAELAFSSWGEKGYGEVWLNPETDWIYPQIHRMSAAMVSVANEHRGTTDDLERRALNQAARELMLAQSSDWPFLIRKGGAQHYSKKRVKEHIRNFDRLERAIRKRSIRPGSLQKMEDRFRPFPEIDFEVFADPLESGAKPKSKRNHSHRKKASPHR